MNSIVNYTLLVFVFKLLWNYFRKISHLNGISLSPVLFAIQNFIIIDCRSKNNGNLQIMLLYPQTTERELHFVVIAVITVIIIVIAI